MSKARNRGRTQRSRGIVHMLNNRRVPIKPIRTFKFKVCTNHLFKIDKVFRCTLCTTCTLCTLRDKSVGKWFFGKVARNVGCATECAGDLVELCLRYVRLIIAWCTLMVVVVVFCDLDEQQQDEQNEDLFVSSFFLNESPLC